MEREQKADESHAKAELASQVVPLGASATETCVAAENGSAQQAQRTVAARSLLSVLQSQRRPLTGLHPKSGVPKPEHTFSWAMDSPDTKQDADARPLNPPDAPSQPDSTAAPSQPDSTAGPSQVDKQREQAQRLLAALQLAPAKGSPAQSVASGTHSPIAEAPPQAALSAPAFPFVQQLHAVPALPRTAFPAMPMTADTIMPGVQQPVLQLVAAPINHPASMPALISSNHPLLSTDTGAQPMASYVVQNYGVAPLGTQVTQHILPGRPASYVGSPSHGDRQSGKRSISKGRLQSTSFGRLQGEGSSMSAQQDVTVEDLIRVVLGLQSHERAPDAISQGLHCLDSSATAALLKELSKQGQAKRAFEIFDWLRQLPATHALAPLCDLYTYTTMIAQCGSAAQLSKALDYVAEMRARGVTCNVHTYSALMNVCMKANELDAALDVFKQMHEAGLAPNLVTYNILIDVHVKRAQWDEAIGTLDAIRQQGIQAEARTYNTVISACCKAGQYDRALRAYGHMLEAGVEPSITTYTAVIGVYGRMGQFEKCLDMYHEMVRRGCERNVITYSSLISAAEKAGQWQVALDLYSVMQQEGCRPNVVTFNSLIAACAHGGKWEKARELFDQMPSCGCKPDAVTYSVLIATYERCQQWTAALEAWENMTRNGIHPDTAVYCSLLEVLWMSGVVAAQARALQVWAAANRAGQLRIYTNNNATTRAVHYSMVTPKPGVAACTVLCWLLELRNKLVSDDTAVMQPYQIVVTLQRTRANRTDAAPSHAAHESVRCLLLGASSPFQVILQPTSTVLTATSNALYTWIQSSTFTELTFLLQVASTRQWSLKQLATEVNSMTARCLDAYSAVARIEAQEELPVFTLSAQLRPQIVNFLLQHSTRLGMSEELAYDGLTLFFRAAAAPAAGPLIATHWPLCLVVCLVICARSGAGGGTGTPALWDSYDSVQAVTGLNAEECMAMETNVITWLNGNLTIISPLRVLMLYQESLGYFTPEFRGADRAAGDLSVLLSRTASSPAWLAFRPSLLAAGLLAALRNIKGILPVWPHALEALTGFVLEQGELPVCMAQVEAALQGTGPV